MVRPLPQRKPGRRVRLASARPQDDARVPARRSEVGGGPRDDVPRPVSERRVRRHGEEDRRRSPLCRRMRRLAGRAGLLIVSALLTFALLTAPAAAEYRHRVVLLEPSGEQRYPELRARLRGELAAAGFDVVAVTPAP